MAKRYIRINWQNAPSVATPRNAENLNIMDKGIDDLDLYKIDTDAIANNLVTTEAGLVLDARQGKVLDDKVNTINNNLANLNKGLFGGDLNTLITPLQTCYFNTSATNTPIANNTGYLLVVGYKNSATVRVQQMAFVLNVMYTRSLSSNDGGVTVTSSGWVAI